MLRERRRVAGLALFVAWGVLAVVLAAPARGADGDPTAEPTVEPSASATADPTPTVEPSPTAEPTPTADPSPTATPTASASVDVTNAELRWGINNESNNRAFAPDTVNFFSAGLLTDPGRGGVVITQPQWQQSAGSTSIEKWNGSTWGAATWAGLSQDSAGRALGAPTAGTFSNHEIVMRGGTGTIDRTTGDAHLVWDADVTVLYYSGMSFFYVSDPVLDVRDGVGTLTATVGGFASSQSDTSVWGAVPSKVVTLAELPDVDFADAKGITAQPSYAGSFPSSFVSFMDSLGTGAFWRDSGSSTDAFKKPLPLAVSYDASSRVTGTTPAVTTPKPAIENDAPQAPSARTVLPAAVPVAAPAPVAVPPAAAPEPALAARPTTELRLVSAPTAPGAGPASAQPWAWWTGGALLLLTALLLLVPAPPRGS